jgi:hemerythrin-like metal-binding protein
LITWDDDYSVGIAEIDEQHKRLVGLVNDLHDAMSVGKGRTVLSTVLTELVEYTAYHFQTEERLFEQFDYPDRAEHKRLHDELTAKAVQLKKSHDEGNQMITIEVMVFLSDWLKVHILQEDKQYSAFLISRGVH